MLFNEGLNYHFLLGTSDSLVRIQSEVQPFYNIDRSKIISIPSLHSELTTVPKFLYYLIWNRNIFESREIRIPEFIEHNSTYQRPQPGWLKSWIIQKSALIHGKFFLERTIRDQMISTRYLSLRDIVNPNFSEKEVIHQIDQLYFSIKDKQTLHRLVKILYAGKPSEEKEIVSNLFTHELEFAKLLRSKIFTIEILPLIHGIFLQDILSKLDERIIKSSLDILSLPVRNMVEASLSKNKWKMVLQSPPLGENQNDNLVNIIEDSIFQKFSRQIYYQEGSYLAYRIPRNAQDESLIEKHFAEQSKDQFFISNAHLSFLARTKIYILFITKDWIDTIQFDVFIQRNEIESFHFYRLPPNLILRIPIYSNTKFIIGAGITKSKSCFEFCLMDSSY